MVSVLFLERNAPVEFSGNLNRLRPYRLLVADDDAAFRETVCAVCRPYLEIVEAATGDEAVARASQEPIDLALCDLHMPGRTGLEVLAEIQRLQAGRPGILMSAHVSPEVCTAAERNSVYRVLQKPFTRRQLLATMAEAIHTAYRDPAYAPDVLNWFRPSVS